MIPFFFKGQSKSVEVVGGGPAITDTIAKNQKGIVTINTNPQDYISRGLTEGASQFNKFGYRNNLTAAGGEETIWATNTNLVIMTTPETFTITYNNTTDGGTTTGARVLLINYLDHAEKLQEANVVLDGTGSVVTSFQGLGINRCVVVSSGTNNTNVNDITITNTTSGNTQAIVPAGGGVTQQGFIFAPDDAVPVTKWLSLNASRNAGGAAPIIVIKGYVYNRTVDGFFEIFRHIMDTNVESSRDFEDPCNFPLSRRDVLYFVADTDRNSTEINIRFSTNLYEDM